MIIPTILGQGSSGGGGSVPSAPIEVATNAQKLQLSGLEKGTQVIVTAEGDRIEQYTGRYDGDTVPLQLGQWSENVEDNSYDGVDYEEGYTVEIDNGKYSMMFFSGGMEFRIYWNISSSPARWEFEMEGETLAYSWEDEDYPWEVEWQPVATLTSPMPTIEPNPAASNDAWQIIGENTCEVVVYNDGVTYPIYLNGALVSTSYADDVSIGWFTDSQLISYSAQGSGLELSLNIDTIYENGEPLNPAVGNNVSLTYYNGNMPNNSHFKLPVLPQRGKLYYAVEVYPG